MLMTVEKKLLTSMFLSNIKAIVQQSSIRIVHRSVSACAHTVLHILLFTLTSERFKMGFDRWGGGGGGGAPKYASAPPANK